MVDLEQELPALRFSIPPYESSTQIITERHWALEVLLEPTSAFMMHRHLPEILGKGIPDQTVPEHRLAGNEVSQENRNRSILIFWGRVPLYAQT